jgi:hypothetical protein
MTGLAKPHCSNDRLSDDRKGPSRSVVPLGADTHAVPLHNRIEPK